MQPEAVWLKRAAFYACDGGGENKQAYCIDKTNLPDGTICYSGKGKKYDYGNFGHLIITLKTKEWFLPYLEKCLWYNSDDGVDEKDFTIEDVLSFYTKKENTL